MKRRINTEKVRFKVEKKKEKRNIGTALQARKEKTKKKKKNSLNNSPVHVLRNITDQQQSTGGGDKKLWILYFLWNIEYRI